MSCSITQLWCKLGSMNSHPAQSRKSLYFEEHLGALILGNYVLVGSINRILNIVTFEWFCEMHSIMVNFRAFALYLTLEQVMKLIFIVAVLQNATIEYSQSLRCILLDVCLCFCTITKKVIDLGTCNFEHIVVYESSSDNFNI